jgi:geranylgeranyl reductase family protein
VVVAGAGPAGATAALILRRLGRRVVLVDKAVFPRDKCCGDGLTAAALRRLERLGLRPGDVASFQPVEEAVVVSPGGRQVSLPLPEGSLFAASARRSDLDAALVGLARDAGAEVVEGRAVTAVQPTAGGVRASLDDGTGLDAAYVVAADGTWSALRRSLGLTPPGYLGDWQAGRQYFEGVGPEARKLWVWFEPDMVPGYAWSFPLPGGAANVGYGVLRPIKGPLRGQPPDWSERHRVAAILGPSAVPSGPWRAWPIPARIGRIPLSGLSGRVLFVGDAAGACDPMTGEGIAQAMETAETAAAAIAAAGAADPVAAARRYRREVMTGMAVDDALSRLLCRVLARPGGSDRALSLVELSGWTRRNFARWMFEDYPRAVLATPQRWRRRLFSSPGAYAGGDGPGWPAADGPG